MSDNINEEFEEEYTPDIVSVVDEEGKEHIFEELDRIETDKGLYVALVPLPDSPSEIDTEEEEFIVLKVEPGDGEEVTLCPIEDDEEYDEVGHLFLDRFAEMFGEEEDAE